LELKRRAKEEPKPEENRVGESPKGVVFHGTREEVDSLDPAKAKNRQSTSPLGLFFTESPDVARTFAGEQGHTTKEKTLNQVARELYQKDYVYLPYGPERDKARQVYDAQPTVSKWERVAPGKVHAAKLELKKPYRMSADEWVKKFEGHGQEEQQAKDAKALKDKLQAEGYDGIEVLPWDKKSESFPFSHMNHRMWVAFEKDSIRPEQEKPAGPQPITIHLGRQLGTIKAPVDFPPPGATETTTKTPEGDTVTAWTGEQGRKYVHVSGEGLPGKLLVSSPNVNGGEFLPVETRTPGSAVGPPS
jgi:hypothetical protein